VLRQTYPFFYILGDEISTLRTLGLGKYYIGYIYKIYVHRNTSVLKYIIQTQNI